MRTNHMRRASGWLVSLFLVGLLSGFVAWGQDYWADPSCYTQNCVSISLKVGSARALNATACAGGTRTADIQVYLDGNNVYHVRVHGTVKDSDDTFVATIDWCQDTWTIAAWQTVGSVVWDCDKSLYVTDILIAWENAAGPHPCGTPPLCADIDPMCKNQATSEFAVAGTEPPNTPPAGSDSSVSTDEDVPHVFTVGDFGYSDAESDPLTQIRITSLESVGDLKLSGADVTVNQVITAAQLNAGSLTYTPLPGESGAPYDTFRFEVHDGTEYSTADYQMTVNVSPVNDPPIAVDDAASTSRSVAIVIPVLANDTDPEGGALELVSVDPPLHGRTERAGDEIRYSPDLFYIGPDTFNYTVRDVPGLTASATVTVDVLDPNSPPTADADGIYSGMVGDPILLDARFSTDPDIQDTLQYRWDIDGDGEWDTEWLSEPTHELIFDRPYRGPITVEVQDLYLGKPNGTSAQATSFALIQPKPTQIAVSVYVDLNGNGEFDEEDAGLPGVSLLFDDALELLTEEDGTAILDDAAPGIHTIRISEEGIAYLQERGFFLSEDALASVELESGEWVALFFNPEARGFLEVDLGAEDDRNSEGSD